MCNSKCVFFREIFPWNQFDGKFVLQSKVSSRFCRIQSTGPLELFQSELLFKFLKKRTYLLSNHILSSFVPLQWKAMKKGGNVLEHHCRILETSCFCQTFWTHSLSIPQTEIKNKSKQYIYNVCIYILSNSDEDGTIRYPKLEFRTSNEERPCSMERNSIHHYFYR